MNVEEALRIEQELGEIAGWEWLDNLGGIDLRMRDQDDEYIIFCDPHSELGMMSQMTSPNGDMEQLEFVGWWVYESSKIGDPVYKITRSDKEGYPQPWEALECIRQGVWSEKQNPGA